MELAGEYTESFADLFRGNQTSHGVHIPEKKVVEGKKAKGESFVRHEAVTQDLILKHLCGEESIGVSPLDVHGNIRFAVIDVDVYPLNPKKYLEVLSKANLPFIGFRSKSGGLHLFLFFVQDTSASDVLPILQEIRQLLGLPKDTELFPKQTRLVGKGVGNWINLPYFKYKDTARYAYDFDGKPLDLRDALALAKESKMTLKALKEAVGVVPMAPAPPCLQTIFMSGGAKKGSRNGFLFNCATYLKARFGDEFAEKLHDLNSKMSDPIEYERLDRTVISSHNKGEYSYQCTDVVLSQFCDKALCREREFGKGAGAVSDLSFEKLIQVQSSTPYYKWLVNGAEMIFYSETELLSQTKFRELCLRLLHKVPNLLKAKAWNEILNRALENLDIEEVEHADDISEDALWVSKLSEFLSRRRAMRPSQVEDGMVWHSDQNKLLFKGAKLLEYFDKTGLFRHFKKPQHRTLLKQLGAKNTKLRYIDLGTAGRVWELDLTELQEKGFFMDINGSKDDEHDTTLTPLDFVGEEKY